MLVMIQKKLFEILPPEGWDLQRPFLAIFSRFEALINSSPLVVELQTNFFLKFWSILMKHIESPGQLNHYKHDF